MPDINLRPRDGGQGAHDSKLYQWRRSDFIVRLYPRDGSRGAHDIQLRPANLVISVVIDGGGGGFPAQISGLRTFYGASMKELCMVAIADAPVAMGGVMRVNKNGTLYAVYLVETSDPNASSIRMRTSTGIKAVRLKT